MRCYSGLADRSLKSVTKKREKDGDFDRNVVIHWRVQVFHLDLGHDVTIGTQNGTGRAEAAVKLICWNRS